MKPTAASAAKDQIFKDHCVIFVDFLGFSNIVAGGDDKMADSLTILKASQSSRSEFGITHQPLDERLGSIEVKAAMFAFSDHVVIRLPA
jgi:hypothetical protein